MFVLGWDVLRQLGDEITCLKSFMKKEIIIKYSRGFWLGLIIKRWKLILPELIKDFLYLFRICNNGQHQHLRTTFRTNKCIYFVYLFYQSGPGLFKLRFR